MPNLNALTNQFFDRREAMRPDFRAWLKHIALLLVTLFTVTVAGTLQPFGGIEFFPEGDPQTWTEIFQYLGSLPAHYIHFIPHVVYRIFTEYEVFKNGIEFSASLLAILTAHEAGHYVVCRLYGVDATLPFFIPLPPMLGPAGTLGAFIKILSPLPSRRATFDIGVAGPIAGFITLIPVAVIGLLTMQTAAPESVAAAPAGLHFSDPLLTHLLANWLNLDLNSGQFNPFLAATWLGLLVTSLNLIPSGQLDGGHAIYAIFGERIHQWTGRIAFAVMVVISIVGWFIYSSPSGILFTVLLAVMLKVKHPEPLDDSPLDFKRKIVAVLVLLMFILCFVPFPVQVR